jgi:hypothetical protein
VDKQWLLDFINQLPDNLFVQPLEIAEFHDDPGEYERVPGQVGVTFQAVYEQKIRRELTLRLNFTEVWYSEFQRGRYGEEQWANIRQMLEKE